MYVHVDRNTWSSIHNIKTEINLKRIQHGVQIIYNMWRKDFLSLIPRNIFESFRKQINVISMRLFVVLVAHIYRKPFVIRVIQKERFLGTCPFVEKVKWFVWYTHILRKILWTVILIEYIEPRLIFHFFLVHFDEYVLLQRRPSGCTNVWMGGTFVSIFLAIHTCLCYLGNIE